MDKMDPSPKRDLTIDTVKAIACILVALGHFFMSMVDTGIMHEGQVYFWAIRTLYTFHVPLFFICSGYLYHTGRENRGIVNHLKLLTNKLFTLGVPFVVFSSLLYLMKYFFASFVNTQIDQPYYSIFTAPLAPYWYLYVLFFCFAMTARFRNNKALYAMLFFSLCVKILYNVFEIKNLPYIITKLFETEMFFLLGMALKASGKKTMLGKGTVALGALFIPLSIMLVSFWPQLWNVGGIAVGVLACLFIFSAVRLVHAPERSKVLQIGIRYNMPIFLMHTIFAAGVRSGLLAAGTENIVLHIIFGLSASFLGPIAVGWVIDRLGPLRYIIYMPKVFSD